MLSELCFYHYITIDWSHLFISQVHYLPTNALVLHGWRFVGNTSKEVVMIFHEIF